MSLWLISLILLCPALTRAQDAPSPRSVLGFTPGDDRTIADWGQITDYFARLDAASDRVTVRTLGETTLGRPLIVAFISSPENIRNLGKLKEVQAKLADPRRVREMRERDRLIRDGKTFVVISCSIHSDEIVASQMSMQLAYDLATASDAATREILRDTVLLLIPSPNPDGVDAIAHWYRKTLGTPYEGTEPPELYHHYAGHDNNRDWFMLNLRETKLITRFLWREWFPQIVYDVHQQGAEGARLFVPPFHEPANPYIAPSLLREVNLLGNKMAADLRAAGYKGVITNASYDTWWHGGFRTAPYYHNSIGLLSEAASAHLMTPLTVTREQLSKSSTRGMSSALKAAPNFPSPWLGGRWRPRDIMSMELLAARSILSMASKRRAEYLRNFYELGRKNIEPPEEDGDRMAYLIPAGQGNDEAVARMIGALVEQGIEVHRLERELHGVTAPQELASSGTKRREVLGVDARVELAEIPAGGYIVFLDQPFRANVEALFGLQVYPERLTEQGEAERPYDVAGWTLPLQMGVETAIVWRLREKRDEMKLTLIRDEAEVRKDFGLAQKRGNVSPIPNPLKSPRKVAVYRSWVESMDEGWTRYVFDTFNVPYESLRDADVRRGNLRARFDAIILPSQRMKAIIEGHAVGSYPTEYTGGVTEVGVQNLRRFVEEGGTLICFDASCELAIKRFNLPLRNVLEDLKPNVFYGPGSIVTLDLEPAHAVARGLPRDLSAYFINSSAFEVTDPERVRVVARYSPLPNLLRSGWLLGEDRLKGKVALAEAPIGRGRVVLFGFRPQHRGQTWATFPLIFNALRES